MTKKVRRTFTEEFKQQIVQLYQNGKPRKDIIREYELTPSSLENKDFFLVYRALSSINGSLQTIKMFHTDRGSEFKNKVIDEALETFKIKRPLSLKGSVAEATFKIIKTVRKETAFR